MRFLASFAVLLVAGLPALAQAPVASQAPAQPEAPTASAAAHGPLHIRGTIVSFDGTKLVVRTEEGGTVSAAVLPDTITLYNAPRKLADIKSGDFLGSAAVMGSDGKLHAQEVRIFPDALRGIGEGQYPMGDPASNRSMTNATVEQVMAVTRGGTLKLSYHGAGAPGDPSCTGHAAKGGKGCIGERD